MHTSSMNPNIIQYPSNFDSASNKGRIIKHVNPESSVVDGVAMRATVLKLGDGPKGAVMSLVGCKRDPLTGTSDFLPALRAKDAYRLAGMEGKTPLRQLGAGIKGFFKGFAQIPGNMARETYQGAKDGATIGQLVVGDLTGADWVQKS